MNACLVRYGAGAVLAAAATGLLAACGVAHAAPGGSAAARPQGPRAGAASCVLPASVRARGELMNAGECAGTAGTPGRGTETYPGRRGNIVLDPDSRACRFTQHPERRELTRSCPVASVSIFP